MPPKAKFTKEEIIEAALAITRQDGLEAVTARELGSRLNSSARPIFTVFQNMEEVIEEVKSAARECNKEYIYEGLQEEPAFKGVGRAYIRFAMEEKRLFRLLFMSEQEEKNGIEGILSIIDENYETILESLMNGYGLQEKEALKLYQNIWIYTHGIASLCVTGVCLFTQEEIDDMLTDVFISLLKKTKGV